MYGTSGGLAANTTPRPASDPVPSRGHLVAGQPVGERLVARQPHQLRRFRLVAAGLFHGSLQVVVGHVVEKFREVEPVPKWPMQDIVWPRPWGSEEGVS